MYPSEAFDVRPILLFEGDGDDGDDGRRIAGFLSDYGFRVVAEPWRECAAERIRSLQPGLVVITEATQGAWGLSACRAVRPLFQGPILMVTARGREIDEVASLEAGADDCLAKPVRPKVLLAHVRALLRRRPGQPAEGPAWDAAGPRPEPFIAAGEQGTLQAGPLTILVGSRTAVLDGVAVPLTSAEFELLWLLVRHAGRVMSRNEIRRSLHGRDHDGLDRSIDLRIHKIRRKLGDDPKAPWIIKSVRGVGYLLMV